MEYLKRYKMGKNLSANWNSLGNIKVNMQCRQIYIDAKKKYITLIEFKLKRTP